MNDPVGRFAAIMAEDGGLKLWSVLVTYLGDLSRDHVADVSGLTLSALVERVGLQPQAMRVALHRLKRDGWIESRRDGRVGYHRLTPNALAQTRAVETRVYGPIVREAELHLVGVPPDQHDGLTLLPDEAAGVLVSRSFALVTGRTEAWPEDWLVARPARDGLPDWVMETLRDAACEPAFRHLARAVPQGLDQVTDPLDRVALRVLILHAWRRLILRSNPAAEAGLGPARAEAACRARVHAALAALGPAQSADQVAS